MIIADIIFGFMAFTYISIVLFACCFIWYQAFKFLSTQLCEAWKTIIGWIQK